MEIARLEEGCHAKPNTNKNEVGDDATVVTELSSFWIGVGVVATTMFSGLVLGNAFTGHALFSPLIINKLLPIVLVLYVISVFAEPRKRDKKQCCFLWLS